LTETPSHARQSATKPDFVAVHVIDALMRSGGGTSYSVPALAAALSPHLDVRIRTLESDLAAELLSNKGVEVSTNPVGHGPLASRMRSSRSLYAALQEDASAGAVFHVHGLWLMSNIYPARVRRQAQNKAALICSPRGMLGREALQISRWKKRVVWTTMQRSALAAADCLHATARSEYEEIRAAGLRAPVAIIPNGIDPFPVAGVPRASGEKRTVLSLGRIHPKKGLDRLVRAWASVEREFPSWRLLIAGPAEIGHDKQLLALSNDLGLKRVTIGGPIYDSAKIETYRSADLFVLPTLNENFGLTVAEALSAEVPVISTKGAPWSGLETERCGWWIDQGVEPLAAALRTAMAQPTEKLREMGRLGRAWMIRDYGWDRIASDMFDVYHWLKSGGSPPKTVQLD
jgi:glycosyltransferase involved in cell wall biosynthesis